MCRKIEEGVGMSSTKAADNAPSSNRSQCSPFLKWAGGKTTLRPQILNLIGEVEGTYYEPFLGGAAIALSVGKEVRKSLSDSNLQLIETYETVRDNLDELQETLRAFPNTREFYDEIRAWDRKSSFWDLPKTDRASRFIFLNKVGFNGLYRVNSKGEFNVPFGDQPTADYVMEKRLREVSDYLNTRDKSGNFVTELICADFEGQISKAGPGDVIYADPPYFPLKKTSDFVSYQQGGFGEEEQMRLAACLADASARGARVIASNSYTETTLDVYSDKIFTIQKIEVARSIGASGPSRGKVAEALIFASPIGGE